MEKIEFFYNKFFYNTHTLCPRLETEILVRKALEIIKEKNIKVLIDVWSGSWIIPISIEKNYNLYQIFAIEKSHLAIKVLRENKSFHNSKIEIIESDLLNIFLKKELNLKSWIPDFTPRVLPTGRSGMTEKNNNLIIDLSQKKENKNFLKSWNNNILITANLPYIKNEDWENMSEDTHFEPKMALFWGKKTGFELYQKFIKQIIKLKKIYEIKEIDLLIEIGFDQSEIASNFLKKFNLKFEFHKDYQEINRVIHIIF